MKVILATGGFGHNQELREKYISNNDKISANITYAGAGHIMAEAVGAQFVGEGSMGAISQPTGMENVEFGMPLTVNDKGELIYGNWFDHSYPMSGTALGGCVSSGRIAAAEIISQLK